MIDLEWMIEDKPAAKNRAKIYEEENSTIPSSKNYDYVADLKDDDLFADITEIYYSTSVIS